MENKRPTLPEGKYYEIANEYAYQLACEKLTAISDLRQQCLKSDSQYQTEGTTQKIYLKYLNRPYRVILPAVSISVDDSYEDVPVKDRVLILHYLITARGTSLTNKLVTFRELPEGKVYSPTFDKRANQPLLNCFGEQPRLLVKAAETLGGREIDYGDTAITINAFSRVPIIFVLWRGDDEFPPQSSILFDSTISDYLPTEDITILSETITWRLVRAVQKV
jgi:hypothetical protein